MATVTFGQRIRQLRKEQRFSQQELAAQVGIDIGYVSKIESDKVPAPSEKVIERLAAYLRANKDELMVLARRAPKDLEPIITDNPRIPKILRRSKGLSTEDWRKVDKYIQQLKRGKR